MHGTLYNLNLEESDFINEEIRKETRAFLERAYSESENGDYVLKIDKQKDRKMANKIREVLEEVELPRILTADKAHQIFDAFVMKYDPDFEKFFNENLDELISNEDTIKDIAIIQRQFKDITRINAGRRITLDVVLDYIQSITYTDIEIGNEAFAEQAKIAGYSQKDFEYLQKIYNEGKTREFSSIPRIQGRTENYTYEMLRCDDPLAITIGTLTDCCQKIHGAGQTSMEHGVVSPDGRIFCVRDNEGRIVAQSWFWRNQYTGCFDNIEIPNRVFKLFEQEHPEKSRNDLTKGILDTYKKAAQHLMEEDKKVYDKLLQNEEITQEQYNALLLGKVTVGLGFNDIAFAIRGDRELKSDANLVKVKPSKRLPKPYTDAEAEQYILVQREGIKTQPQENLYVHQDEMPVYDSRNMDNTVLITMKKMEHANGKNNLVRVSENMQDGEITRAEKIINSIAQEYYLDADSTKVIANTKMAVVYSKNYGKIDIGDLFTAPIKEDLTEEQKQKAEKYIRNQVKKAIRQIDCKDSKINISRLDEQQTKLWQNAMNEIEKENSEREGK